MKKFLTGVYHDLHFIAEYNPERQIYKCIPEYSNGNGTDMTFFATKPEAKFWDTIEEALNTKIKHKNRLRAIKEERQLTGY